jgi:hypothetical protein
LGSKEKPMTIGFLEQMKVIPDHRITGMVTYPLDEILLTTLVGVFCGADDWEAIELLSRKRDTSILSLKRKRLKASVNPGFRARLLAC